MKAGVAKAGVAMILMALATTACGKGDDERRKEADARAAAFTPPSVTSRLDFGSTSSRRFRTLDRDGDDVISADEMPRADSRLLELDRNRDGQITESEFSEGMLKRFDQMDLNQDGTVTSEERRTARGRRPGR